jgi:hypothetical protein
MAVSQAGELPGDDLRRVIRSWLVDVVAKPDSRLGRSGGICPAVRRAVSADALEIVIQGPACKPGEAGLRDLVRSAVRGFETIPWRSPHRGLHALVMVLPGLSAAEAVTLDHLHGEMKDFVVRSGMMFAQFHPLCDVRSVRNPDLVVGSSPLPLLAFRPMAPHDILFLGERREWFDEYAASFGDPAQRSGPVDPFVAEAYRIASAKHCPHNPAGNP